MQDQSFDYYRRHLLFHEATHCFMTYLPDVQAPVWYLEGMAELFGTHRLNAENKATFRVMPNSQQDFAGLGRIETIREDVARKAVMSIPMILNSQFAGFRALSQYSWSWGLCAFLDGSPRYHERFQKLGQSTQGGQFQRVFSQLFDADRRDLMTEWTLFTNHLEEGYDLVRASIDFVEGEVLANDANEKVVTVVSDRGWQSSRIRLEEGHTYQITARGQFSLGDDPKPWMSEPQGITFRYSEGSPIGMLLGCVRREEQNESKRESMLQTIAIGKSREMKAPSTGTLYLRLNDAWNSLVDNHGQVEVTIREVRAAEGQ
jgi:hypothetical protein